MRRLRTAIVVLALLTPACGGVDDEGDGAGGDASGTPLRTVGVVATEYAFDPATIELDEAGTYAFSLRNDGSTEHALEVEGGDIEVETDTIGGGETAELTVELPAGTYELYCPLDGHRERGMEGTLTVGGGATGGTSTGEDEEEPGYGYG